MARTNIAATRGAVKTHEGGTADRISPYLELKRTILTCLMFEDTLYEPGTSIANRIAELVPKVDPDAVARLAVEARTQYHLRHAPLFLISQLAKIPETGKLVESALSVVIERADELSEAIAIYFKYGANKVRKMPSGLSRSSLPKAYKVGIAEAFRRFDEYQLAKYNRQAEVKLKDVLRLVHPKPVDEKQADLWKRVMTDELAIPDTWETNLSAGKDKKETFTRLLQEGKLGGMACLRNLRNMLECGVDEELIEIRLSQGVKKAFPYRFVVAAKYAPRLENAIEAAMLRAIDQFEKFPGKTGLLIDVSGSMEGAISKARKSGSTDDTTRIDVASGLAILLASMAERLYVATFSDRVKEVPPRKGFALRDAIVKSQPHSSTYLAEAVQTLSNHFAWKGLDRMIVITDEQSHDGNSAAFVPKSYLINVAPYKNGVSYGNGWVHIDGWSERVIDYIQEFERVLETI